ncbi:unnamed protein product [Urochloa decumbens]|uniref:SRR1-like domain-containing protein n=1 Tax=Urochloa decumbens TaxID=240449 RepID=A0ABC9D2F2_9POAL
MGNSMAKVSASPPPDPAPDPGPPAEKAMEPDKEALVVPGGSCSSSPGLLMEEFVMGDPARLVASMRLAMELAGSSRLFAKLFDLFASDAAFRDALARVRGGGAERLRVVAYGLGGARYSWAPRFRLAVLLLLRDAFPDAVGEVEVVCPTAAPVERRAMEELGCVVTASAQQCRPVHEPTLIFMPYPDRVFFENLLILNWSAEQLGKIVLLGHSFSTMVKVLELSMSKQEKFGVTEQREKAKRVVAIQQYVREIKLCAEIDGLLDSPLWEDDSPDPFQKREHLEDDDSEDCECMHCAARSERYAMISALPSAFSVHLFHLDPDIDMEHLVPGNSTTMVWSRVNVRMNYDTQLAGWHLNPSDAYIEGKDIKEATSIVKEVRTTMLDVRSSSLYRKFVNQLKENPSIVYRISRMLGAHDCMELVIYGLGSFEFDVKSQYQLALALLLKEDEVLPIGDIEIYDPELSPADVRACFDLGIRVLLVNEQCQRSVEKPTLFYVPGLKLGANLLESNFSPKQKMILVSYGFKDSGESISGVIENWNFGSTSIRDSLGLERDRFVWVTKDYIRGVLSMGKSDERLIGISELKLEFLEVDDDMGIYSKLPRLKLKEKVYLNFMREMEYNSFLAFDHVASLRVQLEERISSPFREDRPGYMADDPPLWRHVFCHRLPAKNRTTWSPPPKGWIKLNFHGIGCSKGRPAGIGGILHNDKGQVLSYYAGPVGDVDQIVASAMALEVGLQNIIELHEPVYKLIVEGDDLKVIRCFNGVSSPPKRYSVAFSYIYHDMCLRPTKKPDAEKLPEECNSGKDDDDGSKDDDNSDHRKDKNKDDDGSQGASSESGIPPGWTRREFIAWHVEEAANLATGLAQAGIYLPRFRLHNSAKCKCGHEMDVKSDKPDITWFPHEDEKMGKWTLRATSRILHDSLMRMRRWGRGLKVLMK